MSEFTKGPWKQQGELTIDSSGRRQMRYEIYNASGPFAHPATAYSLADANLIAAAPEMFDLLRYFATYQCKHPQDPSSCSYCAARVLIAKVEPFGPNTHAGVWIDRETSDKISRDGA